MKLTVLGAGCWGLTLAWLLTNNFDEITVWGRQQDLTEDLVQNKHASKPLEVQLSNKVEITSDMTSAIKDADISGADLVRFAQNNGVNALFLETKDKVRDYILHNARPGDRIIVMGAHDNSLSDFCKNLLKDL